MQPVGNLPISLREKTLRAVHNMWIMGTEF